MSLLRSAVVGVGYLGRFHAQKHKTSSQAQLIGVCDLRRDQAEMVAAELGVRAFHRPEDLIGQVDCVTVAASTQSHYSLAKIFLQAGIPVNVEKPLAATVEQAEELVELAAKKNVLLTVGHIERFNPVLRSLKSFLGVPKFFHFVRHSPFRKRGSDVSVLHDLMIHDLDLLFWFTGATVVEFRAAGTRIISNDIDVAEVFFTMSNGVQAHISVSRFHPHVQRSVRIVQSDGALYADTANFQVERWTPVSPDADVPVRVEKFYPEKADALKIETEAFFSAVRGEVAPAVTGEDGLHTLRWVQKIGDRIRAES
ncbi:MAG: Gfo/Idh/MocA family oxidoreductase [Bdellovibrionaceae bacterium]|nr:Gfo/Idh/MocA family oxidoreductase [Pseudobdellovibrionaceae bacterium]